MTARRALKGIVGLTGTPGTGKKSVAPILASDLDIGCSGVDELARRYGLVEEGGGVDVKALGRRLAREKFGPSVLYGHLLPYVLAPRSAARVAVLRCEPSLLKARLAGRGYPPQKVEENVEAELIGVVSAAAFEAYGGKAFEVDTTREAPESVAGRIARVLLGDDPGRRVDWTLSYDSGAKLRSLVSG